MYILSLSKTSKYALELRSFVSFLREYKVTEIAHLIEFFLIRKSNEQSCDKKRKENTYLSNLSYKTTS